MAGIKEIPRLKDERAWLWIKSEQGEVIGAHGYGWVDHATAREDMAEIYALVYREEPQLWLSSVTETYGNERGAVVSMFFTMKPWHWRLFDWLRSR